MSGQSDEINLYRILCIDGKYSLLPHHHSQQYMISGYCNI